MQVCLDFTLIPTYWVYLSIWNKKHVFYSSAA